MSLFTLWLLTAFDGLKAWFGLIALGTAFVTVILWFYSLLTQDIYSETGGKFDAPKKYTPFLVIIFVLSSLFSNILPSRNDLYFIVGGYYVTNNEEIKKLPDNITGAVNSFLESVKPKELVKETGKEIRKTIKELKD